MPTPGDFDGDGKTDFVYFRPSNATFYAILSSNPGTTTTIPFGNPGDVPAVGDYDGDGKTDFAIFRPSTGYWHFQLSSNPSIVRSQPSQGQSNDIAVPGDYDGDGKADFAVWRPSTQTWYVTLSSNLGTNMVLQLGATSPVTATPVSLTPFAAFPGVSLSTRQTPGAAYTVSGNISLNGANLPGVSVTVTGGITLKMASDLNGNYSFSIPANDSIVITPSLSGYTFSPPDVSWLATANDPVSENFTASPTSGSPPPPPIVVGGAAPTPQILFFGNPINGPISVFAGQKISLSVQQPASSLTVISGNFSSSNFSPFSIPAAIDGWTPGIAPTYTTNTSATPSSTSASPFVFYWVSGGTFAVEYQWTVEDVALGQIPGSTKLAFRRHPKHSITRIRIRRSTNMA